MSSVVERPVVKSVVERHVVSLFVERLLSVSNKKKDIDTPGVNLTPIVVKLQAITLTMELTRIARSLRAYIIDRKFQKRALKQDIINVKGG